MRTHLTHQLYDASMPLIAGSGVNVWICRQIALYASTQLDNSHRESPLSGRGWFFARGGLAWESLEQIREIAHSKRLSSWNSLFMAH